MEESLGWAAAAAEKSNSSSEEPLLLYYSGKGKSSEQLNFIAIAKCFHVIGHMLNVWMSLCACPPGIWRICWHGTSSSSACVGVGVGLLCLEVYTPNGR